MRSWIGRVRHDLVKRVLWAWRDLRAVPEPLSAADQQRLRAGLLALVDDEGAPIAALALWEALRRDAPQPLPRGCAEAFTAALAAAERLARDPGASAAALLAALAALEGQWEALARAVEASVGAEATAGPRPRG